MSTSLRRYLITRVLMTIPMDPGYNDFLHHAGSARRPDPFAAWSPGE